MEPVKVSIYAKGGDHLATVTRNRQGDFVATTEGNEIKSQQASTRATLYTSFYHAALAAAHSAGDHRQAAPRPFLRRRLQAEGQARRHVRGVLRRRRRRRGGRAALHLDDDRRRAAQILPLPHPRRRGRLLRRAGQQREEVPDAQSGQGRPLHERLRRAPASPARHHAHAYRRRLGGSRRHPDPRRRRRHRRAGRRQRRLRQLCPHPPPQRLLDRLRPHVALCRRRRARRRREAGPDHRLCRQ